ncbi:MAG: rRNA methyltransferase [Lentisphaerae bacterium RIFOXYC12_FULL_60_16]|nr:MAG: rRNA methyltransferase [Lentisphaerae bacterium RIFOXYC12_FULL_60_16]OGV76048.1 MAG: rRNA methyltransferase [Lentisphaerae bacterium RIFOXYB12_FULL_60_10]
MDPTPLLISSLQNPRIKHAIRLRQRSHRDTENRMLIEGYRELKRALDNHHIPLEVFFCTELFQGANEPALLEQCRQAGATLTACSPPVFEKLAYRERPEGLLAVAPQVRHALESLVLPPDALLIVAEAIEKPGNLGTILRSADAAGAHAVLVCDRCTDLNNPNVVRASIGTLFSIPVVEASGDDTLAWLRRNAIRTVAATPHTDRLYTEADMTGPVAIILGTEQYGLSERWMKQTDCQVRIPMRGQADSLNVAAAATILLFEAVRQRMARPA